MCLLRVPDACPVHERRRRSISDAHRARGKPRTKDGGARTEHPLSEMRLQRAHDLTQKRQFCTTLPRGPSYVGEEAWDGRPWDATFVPSSVVCRVSYLASVPYAR